MDSRGARSVAGTIGAQLRSVHHQLRELVRSMDHDALNWKPHPEANSIAVLVVHTLGSEREMIRAVRSITSERDRTSEFVAEAEAADLLALLDQADADLDEHIPAISADDLIQLRPRGDRPPRPGLEWLVTNYGHTREHLSQIELTKQLYGTEG